MLAHSVRTVLGLAGVDPVVVVCRPGEEDDVAAAVESLLGGRDVLLVPGGATRHDSEQAALAVLATRIESGEIDVVVVHDGARALAPADLFDQVVVVAREAGGAVPDGAPDRACCRAIPPTGCRRARLVEESRPRRRSGPSRCSPPIGPRAATVSTAPTRRPAWSATGRTS